MAGEELRRGCSVIAVGCSGDVYKRQAGNGVQENAFLHNKYINYLITELKPVTGEIIRQGAAEGLIVCQQPDALAEIVLLVLVVKLDNTLIPSTKEETEQTISELISLLEKGTDNPEGSLNFLKL